MSPTWEKNLKKTNKQTKKQTNKQTKNKKKTGQKQSGELNKSSGKYLYVFVCVLDLVFRKS